MIVLVMLMTTTKTTSMVLLLKPTFCYVCGFTFSLLLIEGAFSNEGTLTSLSDISYGASRMN